GQLRGVHAPCHGKPNPPDEFTSTSAYEAPSRRAPSRRFSKLQPRGITGAGRPSLAAPRLSLESSLLSGSLRPREPAARLTPGRARRLPSNAMGFGRLLLVPWS